MLNQILATDKKAKERHLEDQLDTLCLRFEEVGRESLILLAASPSKEVNRIIITCKLAKAMADRGKKVLLVDANFSAPLLHKCFRMDSSNGLAELLVSGTAQHVYQETSIEGLTVLSAGTEGAIAGRRLNRNCGIEFQAWRERYDLVLIQAPPAKISWPLSLVTKACDGIVFLVKEKKDKKADIKELADYYHRAGKKVLGVIYQKL
ncbi:tyrosine-protein kinase family protein [Bacillus infantis]|uniref:tyrosine-protein kinase family protein n=1 Tax=Bacillus infantis TaxID=324767 RepID=UPI002155CF2B|nr:hypothetical protein [Bacillus infantis]MCR6612954.1 hypothetical protein [Bacillus infantis]